jgi:tRNA1Val (adenine37-N6)-methyltransferase
MVLAPQNLSFDTREMSENKVFKFKYFEVEQAQTVFKIGTDAFVLGAWTACGISPQHILDIGTGTGVLSLMLAQKYPSAQILAIDSNSEAVALAEFNFSMNQLGLNCRTQHADFYQFDCSQKFDLIVSNPPYFLDSSTPENDELGTAKHLTTEDLKSFFKKASELLEPNGSLCMIFPNDERFEYYARETGFFPQRILEVYGKSDLLKRLCVQFGFHKLELKREQLTIRDEHGLYTVEYRELTRDFHGVDLR